MKGNLLYGEVCGPRFGEPGLEVLGKVYFFICTVRCVSDSSVLLVKHSICQGKACVDCGSDSSGAGFHLCHSQAR